MTRSPFFHVFALCTLILGVLLIWVGAAVTTTGSGMAFSDWPLSNGSVNPAGWLSFPPQLLEHGHRLLATLVGLCVLTMFVWQWRTMEKAPLSPPLILIFGFIALFTLVHVADGLYKGSEKPMVEFFRAQHVHAGLLWGASSAIFAAVVVWLLKGLSSWRWPFLLKLSASALVVVVLQAVLGGLRVLEVSDPFGIAHGCLGQFLFCLLSSIVLVSSETWRQRREWPVNGDQLERATKFATFLFGCICVQLLLGAIVRHTQRSGLAATDLLTTGGNLLPPVSPVAVFTIFLHKFWGLVVFTLAIITALLAWNPLKEAGWIGLLPKALLVLPVIQVTLGIYVVLSNKKFWVTNFHVINGLLTLGVAFVLMVLLRARRGTARNAAW